MYETTGRKYIYGWVGYEVDSSVDTLASIQRNASRCLLDILTFPGRDTTKIHLHKCLWLQ